MHGSIRYSKISAVAGAAAALWLCCAGQPARAGGSAGDLAGVQNEIDAFCSFFVTNCHIPMPTLSQAVLELAGLSVLSPETVRSGFDVPVENYVAAGNPSRPPAVPCIGTKGNPCVDPLNPFTLPVDASVLSTLNPIAFTSATTGTGTATPAQLLDSKANIFVYAVAGLSANSANNSQADSLLIFYDDTSRTNAPTAATIGLPLTVLNSDGTERFVPAILNYNVPGAGNDCSASTVTGDFAGTGTNSITTPKNIGVGCAVVLATSPASPQTQHAILEVTARLLITASNDPVTFGNGGFKPAFSSDLLGATPANCPGQRPSSPCILGFNPKTKVAGMSIGVAPSAGPLGPPSSSATYALCASLQTDAKSTTLYPSAAGFYSIAGSGEVFLSGTLEPSTPILCPF